ncbi:MAG TPA: hypothetical protein IAC62_07845 [Candidatus Pelethocola excrementipullorum]|nr:hypothetical protein [Candidatus Pelethocola excrementipullorum]
MDGRKQIEITIGEEDIRMLKEAGYLLCFAGRDKNYDYRIIGGAWEHYFQNNRLEVGEICRIFFCQNIREGEVYFSNSSADIGLGQQTTIERSGSFSRSVDMRKKDRIKMLNNYGSLYPGIKREVIFKERVEQVPVFLAPYASVKGEYEIVPVCKFKLWLAQCVKSGQVMDREMRNTIGAGKSREIELDLTKSEECAIRYEKGIWRKI